MVNEGFTFMSLAKFSSPLFVYITLMVLLRVGLEKVSFLNHPSLKPATDIVKTILHTLIICISIMAALGTFGVDVGSIFEGIGLISFAIGLMFKDVVGSFINGIFLIIYKPFSIGDELIIDGLRGIVVKLDMRYMILENENEKHIIPLSILGNSKVTIIKTKKYGSAN